MKKYILIMLALAGAIAGCKLDEAGFKQRSALPTNSIVGMWFVKAIDSNGSSSGYSLTANDYFMFNNDQTVKASSSYADTVFTAPYSYNASSKKLVITEGDGDIDNFTVSKLTTDSLVMYEKLLVYVNNVVVDSSNVITYRLTH